MAARPAGDAETRLLEAGKELLAEVGFGGLSVRAVAARAGVNLGLVSYHFGGKDAFVRRVAQEVYEEFFREFSLRVEEETDSLAALRLGLLQLARFVRDHRVLITSLVKDLAQGRAEAKSFMVSNLPRHGVILAGLIKTNQDQGRIVRLPVPVIMGVIMGVMTTPTLMAEPMARARAAWPNFPSEEQLKEWLLTDAALELRVDLALKALRPETPVPDREKIA